jgi:hypothetical protein
MHRQIRKELSQATGFVSHHVLNGINDTSPQLKPAPVAPGCPVIAAGMEYVCRQPAALAISGPPPRKKESMDKEQRPARHRQQVQYVPQWFP